MKHVLFATTVLVASATLASAKMPVETTFREAPVATEIMASDFIGMRVYTTKSDVNDMGVDQVQENWSDVGEINDVIFDRSGSVEAVLVDIGGFLGIGERQVAMNIDAISFVPKFANGSATRDFYLLISADETALQQAPQYKWLPGNLAEATEVSAGYVPVMPAYLTADDLTGARVYDAENNWIGEVSLLLLDEETRLDKAVIDIGGFLGVGEKPVALDIDKLTVLRAADQRDLKIEVPMTKSELDRLPMFKK